MKGIFVVGVTGVLVGPVLGLSVLASSGASVGSLSAAAAVALCQTSGPVRGLDTTQARNARIIVAITQQVTATAGQDVVAKQRAELIALMTAGTESALRNYANPKVPASEQIPNDGNPPTGGDHDSVGLFQQRASWGPVSARMNPQAATRLFVSHLVKVSGWQTVPPGVAAQTVQQSARAGYAQLQTAAQGWLAQIGHSPSAIRCGSDGLPPTAGAPVPPGALPRGYSIPVTATGAERRAVAFALAQLGKPYVWDAAGPNAYDCSGLTMAAWAAAGVQLPHFSAAQYLLGAPVASPALLSPGDLIFIPGADGTLNPPDPRHVGMYIGRGYVIEAPQAGDVVKVVPLDEFRPIIGIRHYG